MSAIEHLALLYGDRTEYLAATVPHLHTGLRENGVVLAIVPEPALSALREAMGRDADSVMFQDAAQWYRHPVRTIKEYQDIVLKSAPRRVWAVAEPVWRGLGPAETREWTRYESVVNAAFATSGARVICAYDRGAVAPEVLADARRTHPQLIDGTARCTSLGYVEPGEFGADRDRVPLPPRPRDADYLPVAGDDLHVLRNVLTARALRHGLDAAAAGRFRTAANEAAGNAVKHGAPPVGVWIWAEGPDLICEVGDHGHWRPDPLAGFVPPRSALEPGFGLWTVRLLVDRAQLRTGWDGTFLRLAMRR